MSSHRSSVLCFALFLIGFYLYFETVIEKVREQLMMQAYEEIVISENKESFHSRELLYIDEDLNFPQLQVEENAQTPNEYKDINFPLLKRFKRRIKSDNEVSWKFNVNVTKLNKSPIPDNDLLKDEGRSLRMSVYVDGEGPKDSSGFQHAWSSVEKLIYNLFGSNMEEHEVIVSMDNGTNQIEHERTEEVFSIKDQNSVGRKPKFLSIFNFGGNKENPPLDTGSGEFSDATSQTDLMQDLSFVTPNPDTNNQKPTENIDVSSNGQVLNLSNVDQSTEDSTMATETSTIDETAQMIEFCKNLLNVKKSPRFLDFPDTGSGNFPSERDIKETVLMNETTELPTSPKTRSGVFNRLWNSLPNLRFRGERKIDPLSLENKPEFTTTVSNEQQNEFENERLKANEIRAKIDEIYGSSMQECIDVLNEANEKTNLEIRNLQDEITETSLGDFPNPLDFSGKQGVNFSEVNIMNEQKLKDTVDVTIQSFNKATTPETISQAFSFHPPTTKDSIDLLAVSLGAENIITKSSQIPDINSENILLNKEINILNDVTATSDEVVDNQNILHTTKSGRFFNNVDNNDDAVLEMGSSDERSIFGSLFGSGEEELRISNFDNDMTTLSDTERRFIPNLGFGSGFRELVDVDTTQDMELNIGDDNQNRSIGSLFDFGSGERILNENEIKTGIVTLPAVQVPNSELSSTLKANEFIATTNEPIKIPLEQNVDFLINVDKEFSKTNPNMDNKSKLCDNCDELNETLIHLSSVSNLSVVSNVKSVVPLSSTVNSLSNIGDIAAKPNTPGSYKKPRNLDIDIGDSFPEHESSTTLPARRGARFDNVLPPNWPDSIEETRFTKDPLSKVVSMEEISNTRIASDLPSSTEENAKHGESLKEFGSLNDSVHSEVPIISTSTENVKLMNINTNANSSAKKFCRSARECNNSLNERCISKNVCGCGRAFVRNPETGRCETISMLQTSARLPRERFHKDLSDRNSHLFQKKSGEAKETMLSILRRKPEFFSSVAEVDVHKFEDGSLVVKWNLKVVNEGNESVARIAEQIDKDLKELLGHEDVLQNLPLNLHEASASSLVINPCAVKELNYCDVNADCILDEKAGFKCQCKDGYLDESPGETYSGEVCKAMCEPDFCGDHGQCKLNQFGEKHCLCAGWYFGKKCEWSGTIVICSFGAANIIVVFIVVALICVCRKRRRNCSRNLSQLQPTPSTLGRAARVMDSIALDDIGPASSIEYDSTFDRSMVVSETSKREYDFTKTV